MIDITGPDQARTRQNLLFVEAKTGVMRRSVYTDELRRTPDGWRIARRRCQFIVAEGLIGRDRNATEGRFRSAGLAAS